MPENSRISNVAALTTRTKRVQHGEVLTVTSPFVSAVREAIVHTLTRDGGKLSVVAAQLGTSTRTIQRRLRAEGLSYSTVHDEVRRERALCLVRKERIPMGDVAATLGYRDAGSFTRAFRRWTGTSPRQYRGVCRSASDGRADEA